MVQFTPVPAGNGSLSVTEVAVPVPEALELDTFTVKPTVEPADTEVASAVFVMVRTGGPWTTMVAEAVTVGALVEVAVAVFG